MADYLPGDLIASEPFTLPPGSWLQVTLDDPDGSTMAYFEVNGKGDPDDSFYDLDNFSFGGTTQPDFALVPTFSITSGIGIPLGASSAAGFTLDRFGGSAGDIGFTSSGAPSGVGVTITPATDDNGDGSAV